MKSAPLGPREHFIVREREFLQHSKPLAYSGKRVAQFTKWKTIGKYKTLADATTMRAARRTGLFERAVFLRNYMVIDPQGAQITCGGGRHGTRCTCTSGKGFF